MSNSHLVSAHKNNASNIIKSREFKESIEAYQETLSKNQNDLDAIMGMGLAFESVSDYQNAAAYYEKVISLKPDDSKTLHNLGRMYIFLDQSKIAEKKLKESIEISPTSESAWCDLGLSQMLNNDFDSAEVSFKNSIKLNSRFITAYHNLAECYQQRFKYKEAIDMFLDALQINAHLEDTIASLAETYSDIFETEKALDVLNNYILKNPQSAICHQSRAIILLKEKKFNDGFNDYEWRLNPSSKNMIARPFSQKLWKGENERDKTLLVWLEQGVGDEILSLNLVKYFKGIGLGPTRLISPFNTFINTGNSSILVFLKNRPNFVNLFSSSLALNEGPFDIVLSFIILKALPFIPSLSWIKKTGLP